jgi:hypothetical protein
MVGTKNAEKVTVKLPAEVLDILRWHVERLERENERRAKRSPENAAAMAASDLLFPCEPNGRNRGGGYRTKWSLDRAFEDASKAIGLPYRVTPRALRRTFQDVAREAGLSEVLTRGICLHKSPEMTARYSTVRLGETEAAIGKVIDFATAKRARSETPLATPLARSKAHRAAPSPPAQTAETTGSASG